MVGLPALWETKLFRLQAGWGEGAGCFLSRRHAEEPVACVACRLVGRVGTTEGCEERKEDLHPDALPCSKAPAPVSLIPSSQTLSRVLHVQLIFRGYGPLSWRRTSLAWILKRNVNAQENPECRWPPTQLSFGGTSAM